MVPLLVGQLPLASAGLASAGHARHRDVEAPTVLRLAGGTCRSRRLAAIGHGRRLAAIGHGRRVVTVRHGLRLGVIGRSRLAAIGGRRLAAIGRGCWLSAVRHGRRPAAARRRCCWRCRVRAPAKFVVVEEGGKLLGLLGVDSEYDAGLTPWLL